MRIYAVVESDGWEHRQIALFSTARKAIKYKKKLQGEEIHSFYYVVILEVDRYEEI